MIDDVNVEILARIGAARSLVGALEKLEAAGEILDMWMRAAKGLLFVQNYSAYEYTVVQCVRELVFDANSRKIPMQALRANLVALALDPEFSSLIDGSHKETWTKRANIIDSIRSKSAVAIPAAAFPSDGSHFRVDQLQTIWGVFGLPGPVLPNPRFIGRIEELINNRNGIAHGRESSTDVGRRYTAKELAERVNDTEAICSHIVAAVKSLSSAKAAFA